jgi:hypothetical protein
MKLFKRLLDFFNIHPDKNQRWTLSTLFIVGLLDAYVGPAISKAWVTELPAEWLAFQSLVYSVVGLFIGMIWKGWVRRKAIQWFTVLCVIESAAGFCVGMWLCFVEYNVWVLAIACLLYGTLVSEFIGKCLMTFRPKLWNEPEMPALASIKPSVWSAVINRISSLSGLALKSPVSTKTSACISRIARSS